MRSTASRISFACPTADVENSRPVRRRITPEAGRALNKLAHAVEHLSNEMVHHADTVGPGSPELQAIQILMSLNRRVYDECPPEESLGDRCGRLLKWIISWLRSGETARL